MIVDSSLPFWLLPLVLDNLSADDRSKIAGALREFCNELETGDGESAQPQTPKEKLLAEWNAEIPYLRNELLDAFGDYIEGLAAMTTGCYDHDFEESEVKRIDNAIDAFEEDLKSLERQTLQKLTSDKSKSTTEGKNKSDAETADDDEIIGDFLRKLFHSQTGE